MIILSTLMATNMAMGINANIVKHMTGRYLLIGTMVIFLLGGLLLLRSQNSDNSSSGEEVLSPGPGQSAVLALSFKNYNGEEINLSDFSGQPLVINSWAAWCSFCKQELIDFADLQGEFGDKVKIIAINRQESVGVAKRFSDQANITGRITLLLDSSDAFYRAIDGFSMPETIFVDASGSLVYHKRGVMRADEIREQINNLITAN